MVTRRNFLHSLAGATATIPVLKNDALHRVLAAGSALDGRAPEVVAADEDYWLKIQQA